MNIYQSSDLWKKIKWHRYAHYSEVDPITTYSDIERENIKNIADANDVPHWGKISD